MSHYFVRENQTIKEWLDENIDYDKLEAKVPVGSDDFTFCIPTTVEEGTNLCFRLRVFRHSYLNNVLACSLILHHIDKDEDDCKQIAFHAHSSKQPLIDSVRDVCEQWETYCRHCEAHRKKCKCDIFKKQAYACCVCNIPMNFNVTNTPYKCKHAICRRCRVSLSKPRCSLCRDPK